MKPINFVLLFLILCVFGCSRLSQPCHRNVVVFYGIEKEEDIGYSIVISKDYVIIVADYLYFECVQREYIKDSSLASFVKKIKIETKTEEAWFPYTSRYSYDVYPVAKHFYLKDYSLVVLAKDDSTFIRVVQSLPTTDVMWKRLRKNVHERNLLYNKILRINNK